VSAEASPDTRSLIEQYMKQDPELAHRIRLQRSDNLAKTAPSALPPDLELHRFVAPDACWLAEVALWIRNIFHRHVVQQ
jgi:hypothetical protein